MTKLKELISLITDDEQIKRFQKLEEVIDRNDDINQKFKELLVVQKELVKQEASDQDTTDIKEKYDNLYDELNNSPLVSEYLDYLEEINQDLQLIKEIIEKEIAKDLTD